MPEYVVSLTRRVNDGSVDSLEVAYEADEYKEAWVGARTVCRLGTHPTRRIFRIPQVGVPFKELQLITVAPGVWTVKQIFSRNTRKKGKQRMMTLTTETLIEVVRKHSERMTPELEELFKKVLGSDGGVRITIAAAQRLGLDVEHSGIPPGVEQVGANKSSVA